MDTFTKGLVIGFCIAAPVGPIGLLCIRRSIAEGRVAGFVSGLGAATADAAYGLVAAFGLSAVTHFLLSYRQVIQILGGVFLLWIGTSIIRAKPASPDASSPMATNLGTAYGATFALTLTNPATILSFIGIFAGLGFGAKSSGPAAAALLVAGVFLGSAGWWFLLSTGAQWFGRRIGTSRFHLINVLSGSSIIVFGLWQLGALLG